MSGSTTIQAIAVAPTSLATAIFPQGVAANMAASAVIPSDTLVSVAVPAAFGARVQKSGDTMTGPLQGPKFIANNGYLPFTGTPLATDLALGSSVYIAGVASSWTGAGTVSPHQVWITGDTVDASSVQFLDGMAVVHGVGSTAKGNRNAFHSHMAIGGITAGTGGLASACVSGYFSTYVSTNMGGPGGTPDGTHPVDTLYRGGAWATNPNIYLSATATNLRIATCAENDITVPTGASVWEKIGVFVALGAGDAVQGIATDAAFTVVSSSLTNPGLRNIYGVGTSSGYSPLNSTSTILGVIPQLWPTVAALPTAKYGVDFNSVNFTPGGAAFRSAGFLVDYLGNVALTTIKSSTAGNADINYVASGSGSSVFANGHGTQFQVFDGGIATVNYLAVHGSPTGVATILGPVGADANIGVAIQPKGTGSLSLGIAGAGNGPVIVQGAYVDGSYSGIVPVTGFANTIPNNCSFFVLFPAGTLASGSITMPVNPTAQQKMVIVSEYGVTACTFTPSAGQSMGVNAPTALVAGVAVEFFFIFGRWVRVR